MSLRHVLNVVGSLLVLVSAGMAAAALVSLAYGDGDTLGLLASAALTAALGWLLVRLTPFRDDLGPREGFGIVVFAWTAAALAGSLPYLVTGTIDGVVPALFESMSGFTTTGATVLSNLEQLPHGILFWRSLTQWLGGMGIIVLVIAVLPFLGVGGMQLFRAEVPGPTAERLRPRITQTAKLLWGVYVGLTVTQIVLYLLGGMGLFDAVNHAFTTLATGGFSTRDSSLAAFESRYLQYVTILFMYLAGVNFALHLKAASGRPVYFRDAEWRFYTLLLTAAAVLLLTINLVSGRYGIGLTGIERAFRDSLFQTVSIATTTGFVSADYQGWAAAGMAVVVALMFTGGMAGSTGGGVKAVRVFLVVEHTVIQMRKHLHPKAIYLTRLGRRVVGEDLMANILGFVILYVLLVVGGTLVLTMFGLDLLTSFGASASTVGNIGPGIGAVGPVDTYAGLPQPVLAVLTFLMLVGRLEIYTVLLLFHPAVWLKGGRRAVG